MENKKKKASCATKASLYDARASRSDNKDIEAIKRIIKNPGSLLEVGCGTGRILSQLTDIPHVTGVDLSEEYLSIARSKLRKDFENVNLVKHDFLTFSSDERYDVILFSFNVMSEFPTVKDRAQALRVAKSLLSSDGRIILMQAAHDFESWSRKDVEYNFSFIDGLNNTGEWDCTIVCERNLPKQYSDCVVTYTSKHASNIVLSDRYRNALITRNELLALYMASSLELIEEYGSYRLDELTDKSDNLVHVLAAA